MQKYYSYLIKKNTHKHNRNKEDRIFQPHNEKFWDVSFDTEHFSRKKFSKERMKQKEDIMVKNLRT